jgi:Fe-S cluster biogenesis protein NfuA
VVSATVPPPEGAVNVADVDKGLAPLLPAIKGLGGSVEVVGVSPDGSVELKFLGPERLKKGIEMALKDNKRITSIKFS